MSKTITENMSNKHLIVDSITVRNLKNGKVREIETNVEQLRHAQSTLAKETKDYWTSLAADGAITPEEKKVLYKEWKLLQSEYIALIEDATASGLSEASQELVNYKKEYQFLYDYLITNLKLFDNMGEITELSDRETFIAKYNNYYSARDKLRGAITDGEMADVENGLQGQIDKVKEDIAGITQGSVADGSITVEKLASDIRQDFEKFEAAAAVGFLTDDILKAIDTADAVVYKDLLLKITNAESSSRLYVDMKADRLTTLINDTNRRSRSIIRQTSDIIQMNVVDLENKTATEFKQTADAITQQAIDLRKETAAAFKITADRIAGMVQAGSTEAFLSLSVGIPYYITQSRYDDWAAKLADDTTGLEYLNRTYVKANLGTEEQPEFYYVMSDTATSTVVKSLTTKLRALDALASQAFISADMVQIKGDTIFSADGTLKEAYYDYNSVAPTTFINELLTEGAWDGSTIVKGGFIKTDLIDAKTLLAELLAADAVIAGKITVSNQIVSENYYNDQGLITGEGWGLFKNGKAFIGDGEVRGAIKARDLIRWYEDGDNVLLSGTVVLAGDNSKGPATIPIDAKHRDFTSKGEGTIGLEIGGEVTVDVPTGPNEGNFYFAATLEVYIHKEGQTEEKIFTQRFSIQNWSLGVATVNKLVKKNIEVKKGDYIYSTLKGSISIPNTHGNHSGYHVDGAEYKIMQKYVNEFLQGDI